MHVYVYVSDIHTAVAVRRQLYIFYMFIRFVVRIYGHARNTNVCMNGNRRMDGVCARCSLMTCIITYIYPVPRTHCSRTCEHTGTESGIRAGPAGHVPVRIAVAARSRGGPRAGARVDANPV